MGAGSCRAWDNFLSEDKHARDDMIYLYQIDTLIRTSHLPVIQRQRLRYLLVKRLGKPATDVL
jgi:hypothetical protein